MVMDNCASVSYAIQYFTVSRKLDFVIINRSNFKNSCSIIQSS